MQWITLHLTDEIVSLSVVQTGEAFEFRGSVYLRADDGSVINVETGLRLPPRQMERLGQADRVQVRRVETV